MDYYRNEDKWETKSGGLYNTVLKTVFSSEGSEPVELQEAKDWGKIEQDADDSLITALLKAARRVCEQYTGVGFISRTVTASIENNNGGFNLPYGPVGAISSAVDVDGNTLTLATELGQIMTLGKMVVTYTAGHATLPEELKTSLKQQFLYMYENRGEGNQTLSPMAKMILEPLRAVL